MWDAPLTSRGEEQAAELKQLMSCEHVDLVVSSPLTRAIQTGLLASPPGHHVVTALASEHLEASCDIGRPTSELRGAFQTVDFGDLPEVWWYVPEECRENITVQESRRLFAKEGRRESRRDFERRVDRFVAWLSQRQEKVIAIFAHADFFNCFLHRYFGEKETRYNDYWMKNCEVLQLELPEPLTPAEIPRVPSLPAAALADTEEKDIAQQRPELTPKERLDAISRDGAMPPETSWRAEAPLRWSRSQENKNFHRSTSTKFFSSTRVAQEWRKPPDVALPGKPPSLEDRYVTTCRTQRAVPVPLSFLEGQSSKLDGRDMLEAQMMALVDIVTEGRVEEVNMVPWIC
eukprot:Skav217670  [mRNA]  locus=scaffold2919:238412:251280:+ [translate_table: standard]